MQYNVLLNNNNFSDAKLMKIECNAMHESMKKMSTTSNEKGGGKHKVCQFENSIHHRSCNNIIICAKITHDFCFRYKMLTTATGINVFSLFVKSLLFTINLPNPLQKE